MPTPIKKQIRIVIVDDHAVLRMGLQMLIESRDGLQVVGEASNRTETVAVVSREQPDIILLDMDLGAVDGPELIPELRSIAPQARVIIVTGVRDEETHLRAVRMGAMGLVLKDKAEEFLLSAIEKVDAGEVWLSRAMIGTVFTDMLHGGPNRSGPDSERIASLTEREREVIALLAEGIKNKQIADRLFISEATVRHHLTSVFAKLELKSRFELAIYSFRHGLSKIPEPTSSESSNS